MSIVQLALRFLGFRFFLIVLHCLYQQLTLPAGTMRFEQICMLAVQGRSCCCNLIGELVYAGPCDLPFTEPGYSVSRIRRRGSCCEERNAAPVLCLGQFQRVSKRPELFCCQMQSRALLFFSQNTQVEQPLETK